MPVVKTSRFEINYVEEGEGFPVILIHGLAGDHSAWKPQIATAVLEHDILDQLGSITTPALVMAGRYDPICSMTSQNWMLEALPNAEMEVFENSSHFFLMEEASRAIEVIKNWLAKNSP